MSVSGTKTQKKHIKQPVICKTENVCYSINCAKCYDQYIGETSLQFHECMNNHRSDIRTICICICIVLDPKYKQTIFAKN